MGLLLLKTKGVTVFRKRTFHSGWQAVVVGAGSEEDMGAHSRA